MTDVEHARSRVRLGALAGSVVAVVLALAGCGGDSDPVVTPTTSATSVATPTESTSPTATATPEPTSALPPLPEEATANTPEGAEAFIRYYFDVANTLYLQPQAGLLPEVSDPDCIACAAMEDRIQALADERQRAEEAPFRIDEMLLVGGGAPGVTTFEVELVQPSNRIIGVDGQVIAEGSEIHKSGEVGAIWTGAKWLLYDSGVI